MHGSHRIVFQTITMLSFLLVTTASSEVLSQTKSTNSSGSAETSDTERSASEDGSNETSQQGASEAEKIDLSALLNPEIESASLVAEPVREAPAPVTVITSDMIESIGARNLQEVLTTYVPGMTRVSDKNELNVGLRGIYTSSQQKILILLNGHRLNSRTFSSAPPDFSIGIAPSKIKQIEVVRGPGSAVYGNLALNGVVNIVTKDGEDVDGAVFNAGAGNFGQLSANSTYGEQFSEDHSLLLWASYFRSEGNSPIVPPNERFDKVPASEREPETEPRAHLMGFKDPPSLDVGGTYEFGDFTLLANYRQGKYVPPYSSGGNTGGQTYEYEEYAPWNGVRSGLASFNTHTELSWTPELSENITLDTSLYVDQNRTQQHVVLQPDGRVHTDIGWFERTVGNLTKLNLNYDLNEIGGGSVVVGEQVDSAQVVDSYWISGADGEFSIFSDSQEQPVIPEGNEQIYSVFAQLKHKFGYNRDIIANLGVRYDYKDRFEFERDGEQLGSDIDAVSPRTALIFAPDDPFGLKFSYSESFVDAPYWLRYNITRNFRGTPGLKPERMRGFQLTPTLRLFDERLRSATNFFYITHSDIIFRKQTLDPDESLFQNSGELTVAGVEEEVAFLERDYRIRANVSYLRPVRHTRYPVTESEIHNVPKFFGNLVVDGKPLWFWTNDVWWSVAARYYAEQLSPIDIRYSISQGREDPKIIEYQRPEHTVPQYLLLRSSLRWQNLFDSRVSLRATVHNILDTTIYQGGTTSHPYRQPGRWYLVELGYRTQ